MACPNINLESWKSLVASRGEDVAYYLWDKYDGNVPENEGNQSIVKSGLKATNILQSDRAVQVFNSLQKNKVTGDAFWNKLQNDLQIPKEQIVLLKQYNTIDREQLITNMLADYSYAIEINITRDQKDVKEGRGDFSQINAFTNNGFRYIASGLMYAKYPENNEDAVQEITKKEFNEQKELFIEQQKGTPTQYYSNLTVPGGTNYTENEIATPAIKPSIKGHAQFATDKGIGWFRSDDKAMQVVDLNPSVKYGQYNNWVKDDSNTRRILEVQSDLFQKGRDKEDLVTKTISQSSFTNADTFKSSKEELNSLEEIGFEELSEKGKKRYKELKEILKGNTQKDSSQNKFLQLLNKSNNWVTFFVKSILQDSAKKGYEKVLFPRLDAIIQIESAGKWKTYEEAEKSMKDEDWFKKDKELREELKEQTELLETFKNNPDELKYQQQQVLKIKEQLASHQPTLLNTAKFYETTVANVLKKQGYTPEQVTDEYGNTWNEIELIPEREQKSVLLQLEGTEGSKASFPTIEKVKEACKKMGISIQKLADYAKATGLDTTSLNGVADLVKGIIAISSGREEATLTEEMVHLATAILEQTNPELVTTMIAKIDRFKIYKKTFDEYKNNKNYQLSNGKPDIRKIKKEAVDRLVAELIVYQNEGSTQFPELMEQNTISTIERWWNIIKDTIRGLYGKTNIDVFETVAQKIMGEENIGTVSDIKGGGIFYQLKNPLVDNFYNKIMDVHAKTKLVSEQIVNGEKVKRHYLFDGQKVLKTVTEKIKGGLKLNRTPAQKIVDDQKKEWGTAGHDFIMNYISNNLIDKDGYALPNDLNVKIATNLSSEIQKHLTNFVKELIGSYAPGTRFIVEKRMVNQSVKGMIASTIDFKAIEPVEINGKQDIRVDTFDWKFTNVDKDKYDDIPHYNIKEWKEQMGEYVQMDRDYGIKTEQTRKSRMIPFTVNYSYQIPGDRNSPLVMSSLEIGKLDSTKETSLYLLPVPLNSEKTGNKRVDTLLESLRYQYDKLMKLSVSEKDKVKKGIQLNELSKAIRTLHLRLDFEPLYNVGATFLKSAASVFKTFENLDYSKLSQEDIERKLKELIEFSNSAEKYKDIDEIYTSQYPKEGLDEKQKQLLNNFRALSASTEAMLEKILALQHEYIVQLAIKQKLTTEATKLSILNAQKEINFLSKTFLEASQLSNRIINLAANLVMNAQSLTNRKIANKIEEFSSVLLPLEKEASQQGKSAFDLIGRVADGGIYLIKKLDQGFLDRVGKAKEEGDKDFLLSAIDLDKYNALANTIIDETIKVFEDIQFSSDQQSDFEQREYKIQQLRNSLDITSKTFNGFKGYQFNRVFRESVKEQNFYSADYKNMIKSPAALKVWQFFTELNIEARKMGYLEKQGNSFFPLMEASIIQKLSQTESLVSQGKDFFRDAYTVRVNEEQALGKLDPETGKLKKQIPKFFLKTDKQVEQLSKDLNKVGTLWIKALEEYKNAKNLEFTLLTLHAVEKAKGHIVVDANGNIVYEAGDIKIDTQTNKSADALMVLIDDQLYGITEDSTSFGNIAIAAAANKISKGEEGKEKLALSTKKVLKEANTLTQALAVGAKLLVAVPNYFGFNFQSFISAGNFYNFREFTKNNAIITTGIGLSTIDKGLIDLLIPLNEDIAKEKGREMAWKQSSLKWLSTWTLNDAIMVTNSFPEKKLQIANAMSFNDNSMIVNGEIVNIRQYLKKQDELRYGKDEFGKYKMSQEERKAIEKTFEDRVLKLKETSSLSKVAKIVNDKLVLPNVSDEELAKYRTKVVEFNRKLNGQMSTANKADYRRDTIFKSFMMFKNWIPKQISIRTLDIKKNLELDEWEYGRARLFVKTWAQVGFTGIFQMRDIINGSDKGLAIMDQMLQEKRLEHLKKTGEELEITDEEFYDMVRSTLSAQMRELGVLFSMFAILIGAKIAKPPDDEDDYTKNRYKFYAKAISKITDEVAFYYNPLSFETMTKGSVLPALGVLTRSEKILDQLLKETYGYATDNKKMSEDAHFTKYFLDIIPGPSQFNKEFLPILYPEYAKELGIRVTPDNRR